MQSKRISVQQAMSFDLYFKMIILGCLPKIGCNFVGTSTQLGTTESHKIVQYLSKSLETLSGKLGSILTN